MSLDRSRIPCRFVVVAVAAVVAVSPKAAQDGRTEAVWPDGKRAAVSLTFDDARASQVDLGLALLERLGARATFYVVPERVEDDLDGWKRLAAAGHEIGSHSLRHPCTGNFPWSRDSALEDYTLRRMSMELAESKRRIEALLGVEPVTFAYPCGQTFVGRGRRTRSYVPAVAEQFLAGRGWLDETANAPGFLDLAQLTGRSMDAADFKQVKALVDAARDAGQWLVLAGHDIGESGLQTTRVQMLEQLVPYLRDPASEVWLGTVAAVARHLSGDR